MQRVLVLVPAEDRGDEAVRLVGDLASRAELDVYLVRVLEESLHPLVPGASPEEAARLRGLLVEAEVRELDQIAAALKSRCRSVSTCVRWGVPWEVVLEGVAAWQIDLVVKPARGLSHRSRVFFGATALQLFRKSPRPVWVVGDQGRLPSRILAAIDPGNGHARAVVSRRILEWASWMAALCDAELHVISCWNAPAAELLKGEVPSEQLELYVKDAQARAHDGLARAVGKALPQCPQSRVHLIEGNARELLPRFAEEQDIDVIVMGSQGKNAEAGDILGETAELVVRAVRSSVMTVSPQSPAPSSGGERGVAVARSADGTHELVPA